MVRVGDLACQVTDRVKVEKEKEYKLIGAQWYGKGTFHRETLSRNELSANWLTPVIPDAFVYNRLFAWKESFAVVPSEHAGHFVSGEFPQFIVDDKRILPRFLDLFFMLDSTIRAVNAASVGSAAVSHNRFKEEEFVEFQIPLPPLATQRAIVARWQAAQAEIAAAAECVKVRRQKIEDDLLSQLSVSISLPTPRRGAFAFRWNELGRWDTFFNRTDFSELDKQLSKVNHRSLGELLKFESRSWSKSDFPSGTFQYVEISAVTKEDGITSARTVEVNHAPSRATTLIRQGDIILATTRPYLGAFTIVRKGYDGCVCSSGFALATGAKSPDVESEYVLFFLRSAAGLRQMERRMTGGLYPAIVHDELERIKVPLPPLAVQREIVARVQTGRAEIAREREAAQRKAQQAQAEIEALILGTKQI